MHQDRRPVYLPEQFLISRETPRRSMAIAATTERDQGNEAWERRAGPRKRRMVLAWMTLAHPGRQ